MKKKVVIIDDEVDLCHLLNAYLSELNYDVHLAHTLQDGVSLLDSVKPDVVFIDNNLPDGLGWEYLPLLKRQYPSCKINLISAYHSSSNKLQADEPNINVLEKPLRLNALKQYLA